MNTAPDRLPDAQTIQRTQFANGVTLLVHENPTVQSVFLTGSLRTGAIYSQVHQKGLANLTAEMLLSGTTERDFERLHSDLEDLGAEIAYSAGRERTLFSGRSLAEDVNVLLEALAETMQHPSFPEEDFERERDQQITELRYLEDDTRYRAMRRFREMLYAPFHPYRYPTNGTEETLRSLTLADVQRFHQTTYGPQGMILVVVGAVQAAQIVRQVETLFSDWQNPAQHPALMVPSTPSLPTEQRIYEPMPGKSQSDVLIGTVGPSRLAPDYRATDLANSVLGEFGLMGRVGLSIREDQGLAYYAYSRLEGGEGQGAWYISAGVDPQDVEAAIASAVAEIERLVDEPISVQELDDNQAYFVGRLPLKLEQNSGVATIIHALERYELGLNYLHEYPEEVRRLTVADVQRAAQHYFDPQRLAIVVAGPPTA